MGECPHPLVTRRIGMYTDFFQLREEPFQVTPNPKYLFLSTVHREALQKLADGVRRRKGFIEMVGAAGTGKTLLCKELIQMLSPEMDIAYLFYPVLNEQSLYYAILKQWGIPVSEETPVPGFLEKISEFLKERFQVGKNALIILDEAQNLSVSLLENLRLLSNLETESEKLLQILLTGQPEFHELLKSGKIPQLDQRIRVRIFLKPLDRETLPLYIYHRLNTAGDAGLVEITEDALNAIYARSNGIPRIINAICERALEEAFRKRSYRIDAAIVQSAQEEFDGGKVPPKAAAGAFFTRFAMIYRVGMGILIAVFLGLTLWLILKPGNKPLQTDRRSHPPIRSATHDKKPLLPVAAAKEIVPVQGRPLDVMRHFLEGMLPIPEGEHLYWGDIRLGRRDLTALHTPVLLDMIQNQTRNGWICVRNSEKNGLQVWKRGSWKSLDIITLRHWTGRCQIPFWVPGTIRNGKALHPGDAGPAVASIQTWLSRLGLLTPGGESGTFDAETEAAVRQFQRMEGLTPDGIAGRQTLALLFQRGAFPKKQVTKNGAQYAREQ